MKHVGAKETTASAAPAEPAEPDEPAPPAPTTSTAPTTSRAATAAAEDSGDSDGSNDSDDEVEADEEAAEETNPLRKSKKNDRVTCNEYYRYLIAQRLVLGIMHLAGKLFQKFLVDAWLKCESNTLEWIRKNQPRLRIDKYSGLKEHLANLAKHGNARPGVPVVLPASHTVSERITYHLAIYNCDL